MVLTGYNTDIEYRGVTYHVQTEDKGSSNPFIESLVYARGEILYSRRTPYHELVEQEADPKSIASLKERQHRTIAEAIRRGRLSQLAGTEVEAATSGHSSDEPAGSSDTAVERPVPTLDEVILEYLEAQRGKAHLILRATQDQDFVYGQTVNVKIVAVDSHADQPQQDVKVMVLFKSTAEPRRLLLAEGQSDESGSFGAAVVIPPFNGGTSAVVISAQSQLGQSEIKHLVHR